MKHHLCKWTALNIPKECWGWDLLDQRIFGYSLLIKYFWSAINGSRISHDIFKGKYMKDLDMEFIYRNAGMHKTRGSMIWRSFVKIMDWWCLGMALEFGNGQKTIICSD